MTDWLGLYDRMTLAPECKKTHDHGFLWRGVGIARARLCANGQIIHVDICDRHSLRSVVDVLVIGYSCREPCAGLWASMCRPVGSHMPASGLPYAGQRASICGPAGFHMPASGLPYAGQRVSICRPAKINVRRVMARRCLRMKKRTHFTVGPFELKLTHVSS